MCVGIDKARAKALSKMHHDINQMAMKDRNIYCDQLVRMTMRAWFINFHDEAKNFFIMKDDREIFLR